MAISGTDRGSGANNVSATTLVITPGSTFTGVGALAVLCVSYDNSGTNGADPFASITDSRGNTWTSRVASLIDPGAANAGAATRIFESDMAAGLLTTSDTITISFGAFSVPAKAWALHEVTPSAGYKPVFVQGAQATQTSGTPSITTASITSGNMVIGVVGREGNSTRTGDADTLNGSWSTLLSAGAGTTTSGQEISTQRKVVNASAAQTYNPTYGGTSRDGCNLWAEYTEVPTVFAGRGAFAFSAPAPTLSLTQHVTFVPDAAQPQLTGEVPVARPSVAGAFFSLTLLELGGAGESQSLAYTPAQAPLAFLGLAPTQTVQPFAAPAQVPVSFTGLAPVTRLDWYAYPAAVAPAFAGHAPALLLPQTVLPGVAAAVFSGPAPSTTALNNALPFPGVGTVGWTGVAPTTSVSGNLVVMPAAATANIAGEAPTGLLPGRVAPNQAAAVFAGLAPVKIVNALRDPAAAVLSVGSPVPLRQVGSESFPLSASAVFAGRAPALGIDTARFPAPASLAALGFVATGVNNETTHPGRASVSWAGPAPTFYTFYGFTGFVSLAQLELGGAGIIVADHKTAAPSSASVSFLGQPPTTALSSLAQRLSVMFAGVEQLIGFFSLAELGMGGAAQPVISPSASPDGAVLSLSLPPFTLLRSLSSYPAEASVSFSLPQFTILQAVGPQPGRGTAVFSGTVPVVIEDTKYPVPPTDFSIPPGWYADPGYSALYVFPPAQNFSWSEVLLLDAAVVQFVGVEPITYTSGVAVPGVGLLALSGLAPVAAITLDLTLIPAAAGLTFEGQQPLAGGIYTVFPSEAVLSWSGYATEHVIGPLPQPGAGLAEFLGWEPAAELSTRITKTPDSAVVSWGGYEPTLSGSTSVLPDMVLATTIGYAPSVAVTLTAEPEAAALSFAQDVPESVISSMTAPAAAAAAAAGLAPTAHVSDLLAKFPDAATAVVTGREPTLLVSVLHFVAPAQAELSAHGEVPEFDVGSRPLPGHANLGIVGRGPQIVLSQHVTKFPGAKELIFSGRAPRAEENAVYGYPEAGEAFFTGTAPTLLIAPKVRGHHGQHGGHSHPGEAPRRPSSGTTARRSGSTTKRHPSG